MIEFTGKNWIPFPSSESRAEGPFVRDIQVSNLGLFHIWRTETWTSVCYDLQWRFVWGRTKAGGQPPAHDSGTNEAHKGRVVFLREKFIWQFGWRLLSGDIVGDYGHEQIDHFKSWLEVNYPGVEIPLDHMPRQFEWSELVGGLVLQVLVTVILGALTRFHVGNPSHAVWLLIWLYGSASLRWMWLVTKSIYEHPSLALLKWVSFWFSIILEIFVAVGICCGITVALVELFEALCGTNFTLSTGWWILIGTLITAAFTIAAFFVIYLSQIIGISKRFFAAKCFRIFYKSSLKTLWEEKDSKSRKCERVDDSLIMRKRRHMK